MTAVDDDLRRALDAELWKIEATHHFHGEDCLCGFSSSRSRSRTEHLTGLVRALLDAHPARAEDSGAVALIDRLLAREGVVACAKHDRKDFPDGVFGCLDCILWETEQGTNGDLRLIRDALTADAPASDSDLMEQGRRLAGERDDLIARGVNPADLIVPLAPASDQPSEGYHCHHCGLPPEADGDHTCTCPKSDSECLEHTLNPVPPVIDPLDDPTMCNECGRYDVHARHCSQRPDPAPSVPDEGDVEALAAELFRRRYGRDEVPESFDQSRMTVYRTSAEWVLASSWLAQRDAATRKAALNEAIGLERGPDGYGVTSVPVQWLQELRDR